MKTINLIPVKPEESPQNSIVTVLLRRLSLWTLTIFMVSGVVGGGIYYYMKVRYDQVVQTKQDLSRAVEQNATKEGLLASLKQRTALIAKILGVQKPAGNVFDVLFSFVPPDQISTVSVDEKDNVSVTVHAASIADVISITDGLIKQATARRVRAPQLVSLTIGRTGGFDIGLSFISEL